MGSQLPNNEKKLATLTNNEVLDVLIVTNVSRPNNFNSLTKEEWKWIVTEIKKDFGEKLTLGELVQLITNGVKGEYDKTQFVVNGFTIYRWIKTWIQNRPTKVIPKPNNIEDFYWNQMSVTDQQKWIDNQPKKIEIKKQNTNT